MPCYTFNMAGICIQLDTPFSVAFGAETAPFLTQTHVHCQSCIVFRAETELPAVPKDGRWVQDRCYAVYDGSNAIFVRIGPDEAPYALITERPDGYLCRYIPEFEKSFYDCIDILNLMGMEGLLLRQGGMLLHASLVRWNNRGILFSAPCGTGKSTQAELWEACMGSDTLNGDRAGIRCVDGVWKAFGMPFAGTSRIYRNESAPIAAIVVLAQGAENRIQQLQPVAAVRKLLPECSCRRWDPQFMDQMLSLLFSLVQQIPIYHLECRPDRGAVHLLHDTITKEEIT